MADQNITASARALLTGLIDYAGLFPPAGLDMASAVRNYLSYRSGAHAWMLGTLVIPTSRLAEFRAAAGGEKLPVSILIGNNIDEDVAAVSGGEFASIEVKASTATQIRSMAARLEGGPPVYFEVPTGGDPRGLIAEIAEAGARAKVRTGGLTPEAFLGSRDLVRFLQACAESQVPFKATAGLHHPVRGSHGLTKEPGSATVVMHGFLNLLLGAALLRAGESTQTAVRLLEDQTPGNFLFDDGKVSWRDQELDVEQIEDTRQNLAISLGSCSFEEPIAELQELGVL